MDEITADSEVVGVVFTGSIQQGRPSRTSDLDLYVVTHKDHYWRATRIYEGVTAELFINSVASMRWRITRPDEVAATAGFATGEILLDRTGEVAELQAIAKQRWEAGPPALLAEQIAMVRYTLNDMAEDLEDVAHDPVAARLTGSGVVTKALELWCKLNRHWGDKPKRLAAYVAERDPELGRLVTGYYAEGLEHDQALQIVEYVLAPVGGRLVTWESTKVKYSGGA